MRSTTSAMATPIAVPNRPRRLLYEYSRGRTLKKLKRSRSGGLLDFHNHMRRKPKVLYVDQHKPETLDGPLLVMSRGSHHRARAIK